MIDYNNKEDKRLNHSVIKSIRYAILGSFLFGLGRVTELWLIPPIEYKFIKQKLAGINQSTPWPQRLFLEEKLTLILQEVGHFKTILELFKSKDFVIMYRYPKSYLPYVLKLLENPAVKSELKAIAIYAMEQLEIAGYLTLLNSAWESYQKKELDRELLERILYYELAGEHPIVKHYADPNVSHLLETIWRASNGTSKTQLGKIISGEIWKLWQQKKVGASFQWGKKPFPFIATLDQVLSKVKVGFTKDSENGEGVLWCEPFMLLYEHPTYYVEDAYAFLNQSIGDYHYRKKYRGCATFGMALGIVINAFRKLDCEAFIQLFHQMTKLHIPHKSGYCNMGVCYPEFSLFGGKLVGGQFPTMYDTLLLRPFPVYASGNIFSKCMCFDMDGKGLPFDGFPLILYRPIASYYDYVLKEIEKLQILYGIPSYSEERPFISFTYFDHSSSG
ncbi:hypothetical protein [Cardinium endosymbiont of Dermatophagoides farinae]|uniref:hypothetical protein n=1 Tax=Cardinium endosymbiont of Dermatophagoides farinae TaxID=2597823 RepID=UPI00118447FA|nr:hypothetical protein [Cardinium endosymbiont of Dermatophagoides farinae]TSJ81358.1 hypothetical protein FPG78_05235 [Cardinium endosymbiont of Dermatophagoides farinae]